MIRTEFIGGYTDLNALPRGSIPEIAIVGRSNVGKSSFINRLCGRDRLARVSSKPGHTRELNLYKLQLPPTGREREKGGIVHLVDLPGFGYAKFSRAQREQLWELVHSYLVHREQLSLVCLLNDVRRDPENEELALQRVLAECGKHILVVLTKVDKVKRKDRERQIDRVAHAYGLARSDIELTSSDDPHHEGVRRFWGRVSRLLAAVR